MPPRAIRVVGLLCAVLVLVSPALPSRAQTAQETAQQLEDRLTSLREDLLDLEADVRHAQRIYDICLTDNRRDCTRELEGLDHAQEIVRLYEAEIEAIEALLPLARAADFEETFAGLDADIIGRCVNSLRGLGVQPEDDAFFDALALCYAVETAPGEPAPPPGPPRGEAGDVCPALFAPGVRAQALVAPGVRAQAPNCPLTPQQTADKLAEAVRAQIPQMPFYGQSGQAKANEAITTPLSVGWTIAEREHPQGAIGAVPITFPLQPGESPALVTWEASFQVAPVFGAAFRTPEEVQANFAARQAPCGTRTVLAGPFGAASCAGSSGSGGRPYTGFGTTITVTNCADIQTRVLIGIYTPPSHGAEDKTAVINTVRESAQKWAMEIAQILNGAVQEVCPR